jgi:probable rRNA maturation factor
MKRNSRGRKTGARNAEPRRAVFIRRERNLRRKVSVAAIRRAVRRTLEAQGFRKACTLTVLLAGEETVAALNAKYRRIPHGTDVLSFSSRFTDPETGLLHLGDVVISLPRAARQAAARRAALEKEVLLLTVHGTLHLLGYDHGNATEKRRMWRAQKEILKELA